MTLATRASQAAHVRAIVEPVTLFDMLLSKFPYLPSCDVLIPPTNGWPQDDISNFRKLGKTDLVVEVLKSLPYISTGSNRSWRPWRFGYDDTKPIAHAQVLSARDGAAYQLTAAQNHLGSNRHNYGLFIVRSLRWY
jgi:hypothetical protein